MGIANAIDCLSMTTDNHPYCQECIMLFEGVAIFFNITMKLGMRLVPWLHYSLGTSEKGDSSS